MADTSHKIVEVISHCRTDLRNLLQSIPPETLADEIDENTMMLAGKCLEKIKICTACLELQTVLNKLYSHVLFL